MKNLSNTEADLKKSVAYKKKACASREVCTSQVGKADISNEVYCATENLLRSSHPEVFLGNGALKIRIKFTGEHPH